MSNPDWINKLFQVLDKNDVEGFLTFLSEDALFRFGNADPVIGKGAIREAMTIFYGSIKAISHKVRETWVRPDTVICHGSVTYTRHDSSEYTVLFADIFKMDDTLIKEYLIYIDNSELYTNG